MPLRFVGAVVLALSLVVFATLMDTRAAMGQSTASPPAAFSHRVASTHVTLYWNCLRPESGVLRLEGVAHNPYFSEIRFLEIQLAGVDNEGRVVSETKAALPDIILRTNQFSGFRLDLKTSGSEARFDLFYRYRSQENLRSTAGPGISVLKAASAHSLWMAQAEIQFLARDVCSEDQHRIRKGIR